MTRSISPVGSARVLAAVTLAASTERTAQSSGSITWSVLFIGCSCHVPDGLPGDVPDV